MYLVTARKISISSFVIQIGEIAGSILNVQLTSGSIKLKLLICIHHITYLVFCISLFDAILTFNTPSQMPLWKHCGKRRNAGQQHFSFSHNVFYSVKYRNLHLSNINFVVSPCFKFGSIKKFAVRYRLKQPLRILFLYTLLMIMNIIHSFYTSLRGVDGFFLVEIHMCVGIIFCIFWHIYEILMW